MSGSHTSLPVSSSNMSDFAQYLLQERAKSIPVAPYELHQSLRIWLKNFTQQAAVHGITDMNLCAPYLPRYMPLVIQQWIPTLAGSILTSWSLVTEALLARFGLPEEEDNRRLLKQLRNCKKQPNESVRLHAAKWEHLLSLISDTYSQDTQITYFIQSLDERDTKLTLTSLVAALNITSVSEVIRQAINLEVRAKLLDEPETVKANPSSGDHFQSYDPTPMDIDYMSSKNSHKPHHNKYRNQSQYQQQLRAYDKQGNPICDYCRGKHRTVDHNRNDKGKNTNSNRSNNSQRHVREMESLPEPVPDQQQAPQQATSSFSVDICHFTTDLRRLPRSTVYVNKKATSLLWDTGADINGIQYDLFSTMNIELNKQESVRYRDVNSNIKNTCGTAIIPVLGQQVKVHVIEGISSPLIIGWDTICDLKGHINSETGTVKLTLNDQTVIVPLDRAKPTQIQTLQEVNNDQAFSEFILDQFGDVIAKDPNRPSVTHLIEFTIDTGDSKPIYNKPRIFHPDVQAEIDEKLESMVESGLLEKIQFTQWGSQVRPVQKPDGTMRVCGNYVAINLVTVPIKYPFPNMHHLLQSLGQAKVFSKLDLAQGYFQIPIKQEHKEKTALVTVNGTYVFTVMPMGMKNAPAVFQSLMDKVLGSFRYSFAFAYQDDIIVYSRSVDEHKQHLCQVLTQLRNANLSIKLSKSQFCLDTVEYLGFIVSKEGVSASPDKIKPILNYETPTSLTELERFLGMTGVYQRFISQYQIKTEPLRRLKKKDTPFIWSKEQQQAFDSLKEELCLLPTLKQPDFSRPFELHTDAATSAGIAVILCQKHDNTPYPLAYASRALTIHEQRYSVREQECLSIIFGIKKFRPFLERKTFYIYTDHSSLQWIQNVKDDVTPRIWRWTMFLQSYQFEIIHVPGRLNSAADALSRHSVAMSNIQVHTSITDNIDWSKLQDEDASLYEIKNNIDQHELYVVIHNILYISKPNKDSIHHNDLYLVVPDQAIQDIWRLFHSSPLGGHFGAKKTKAKITQQSLWWNNMGEDIKQYCKSCDLCQRIKGSKSNNYNISNTSKDFPFFRVALDFFGPLPTSLNQNSHILVVIDCFSRYVEIYPVKSTTQEELAKTFFDRFILRHGVPQEILSDGGPPFNSMFFAQLSTLLGSKQLLTPPWHPQSNGIVERFMLTLRRMILTYTDQAVIKTEWDQHLRILQFVYNSTQHEGTGFAPFYLVHGRHPKAPLVNLGDQKIYEHYQSPSQQFTLDLQNRLSLAFEIVDNNLNNNEYKNKENPFQVNEKVLLFNQSLSSSKKPRKLMFDWLGPFIVTNLNSKSVVNLKDTLSNKTVLNVHISRLKKFIEPV